MATAISTRALTRRFGVLTAVDRLGIDLPSAGVVGLVGPNGSGKSTLIRMLLGLIRPTSGEAEVLGRSIGTPAAYAAEVGALVEGPSFIPGLSAEANLRSLAQLRGLGDERVPAVLDSVGLTGREREPVRSFSLGMKQRLSIAAALLPDPDLLLLDEPTNGLDPAGIVEIRRLLRALADDGRTVVVSSHLLSEIQAMCDYLVVIRFGELLFSGPLDDLLGLASEYIEVEAEHARDDRRLEAALTTAGWAGVRDGGRLRLTAPSSAAPAVNRAATAAGISLRLLVGHRETLETVFLRLTGGTDGELTRGRSAQVDESGARGRRGWLPGRRTAVDRRHG